MSAQARALEGVCGGHAQNASAGMMISMRMMETEIDAAKAAMNSGDIAAMASALLWEDNLKNPHYYNINPLTGLPRKFKFTRGSGA